MVVAFLISTVPPRGSCRTNADGEAEVNSQMVMFTRFISTALSHEQLQDIANRAAQQAYRAAEYIPRSPMGVQDMYVVVVIIIIISIPVEEGIVDVFPPPPVQLNDGTMQQQPFRQCVWRRVQRYDNDDDET